MNPESSFQIQMIRLAYPILDTLHKDSLEKCTIRGKVDRKKKTISNKVLGLDDGGNWYLEGPV